MATDVTRIDSEAIEASPVARNATRSRHDPISGRVAAALLMAWVAGVAWVFAITPAPDPAAPIGTLDVLVSLALYGSWGAVVSGLARRRRMGINAGIVGGIMLAGAGLLCLATGHTGAWIAGQIVVGAGLAAMSATASKLT